MQEDQKLSESSIKWCGQEQIAVCSHKPLSGINYNVISSENININNSITSTDDSLNSYNSTLLISSKTDVK